MRVLLDECVPIRFRKQLAGHDVRTIRDMGWAGLKNGKLLAAMTAEGFEAFVTVDKNIQYEQNLSALGVGVILMDAVSNNIKHLMPLVPGVLSVLQTIKPGDHIIVQMP